METPRRVAKAYVNDLWKGRYNNFTEITSFPSDGYDGIIIERNIPTYFNVFSPSPNNSMV
jgi:GTP cyclohydrolase IA